MKVLTAHQTRNIDHRAMSRYHMPGLVLMENAGRAVVEHILDSLEEDLDDAAVAIVCGKGNNGGDGFVVARHLHGFGITPHVFLLARRDDVEGDAATNLRISFADFNQHTGTFDLRANSFCPFPKLIQGYAHHLQDRH